MAIPNLLFLVTLLFSPCLSNFPCYATSKGQPNYLSHACSSNETFTANSAFQSNLNTVLSSLSSANADFYNTTAAGGGDTGYGLFMCRVDVTLEFCNQCVVDAIQRLTSYCQFSKEAAIWYDECILGYSNTSFSTGDTKPLNTGNIANTGSFMRLLFTTVNEDPAWRWNHGYDGTRFFKPPAPVTHSHP